METAGEVGSSVECADEKQANEALKEAMDLLKLHHSNICAYKELFVAWDDEAEEITLLLQDIRRDNSHLEGVLPLLQNGDHSSLPLFPILFTMLQIQPSMRPTAKDLIDVPFIGECLIAAGSSLIKQKNTLSSCIIDVFLKGGFGSILGLMQAFWDVEEVQARAMQHLASFVGDKSALPYLLAFSELIVFAMKSHMDSPKLQVDGCSLLLEILSREVAAENLRKAGLISDLLSILQNFIHNEQICHSSCAALWSLAVSGFLDENDYEPTTALLMDALRMNMEGPMLVNNTCLALASLLRLSEISAFRFITDSKGSGINLIKDAYHFYCDDPQVVESICMLINEMAQYGDNDPCGHSTVETAEVEAFCTRTRPVDF
ncbi:hypothetical protein ASZ78_009541 [Callipepla squamata]|uniref:non-specific serine/threonine protein kinase n=1 Tax=Callipepla squamata TaxID=9009 RepID=A0A226NMT5_CALSU|nr:hypothetical protein ASZ78_009541 [Callipepla squamata]